MLAGPSSEVSNSYPEEYLSASIACSESVLVAWLEDAGCTDDVCRLEDFRSKEQWKCQSAGKFCGWRKRFPKWLKSLANMWVIVQPPVLEDCNPDRICFGR